MPTLRASTTRLLAICSHHPTRLRNKKSSTTSTPGGDNGAFSEYFVFAPSQLSIARTLSNVVVAPAVIWRASRRPARLRSRRRCVLLRRPRRDRPSRRPRAASPRSPAGAGCTTVYTAPLPKPGPDSGATRIVPSGRSLSSLSVSTTLGAGAANTTSENPASTWNVWRNSCPSRRRCRRLRAGIWTLVPARRGAKEVAIARPVFDQLVRRRRRRSRPARSRRGRHRR